VAAVLARRRASFIAAVLVVVLAVVAAVLLLRGGDDRGSRATARAEPLAYVPDGADDAVFDVDTGAPLVGLGVEQLAPRLTNNAVSAADIGPLVGGRAAVAMGGGRTWLVFATDAPAPRLRAGGGAVAARRAGVVVIAKSPADLDAAFAAAARPSAREARATFDKRFAGLPTGASVRLAFDPHAQLAQRAPQLANTRWARSLRDGAAVLTPNGSTLRVPFRITADPVGLNAEDLPIVTGPQAPQARGSAPLVVGLRNPARTLQFARDVGLFPGLDLVDQLPGFLKPNLDDLGPNGTLTTTSLTDLDHVTLRAEPSDPGDWSAKLGRLYTLAKVAGGAVAGVKVVRDNGTYTVTQNGNLVAKIGVFGRALVLSNDEQADLPKAANAAPTPTLQGAAGALTAQLLTTTLAAQLPDLIRGRLGAVTGWARAELTGVSGQVQLGLR
jgi:hypothetical protein